MRHSQARPLWDPAPNPRRSRPCISGDIFSWCYHTCMRRAGKIVRVEGIFFWLLGRPKCCGCPSRGLPGALESVRGLAEPHTSSPVVAGQSTIRRPNAQNPTRHRRPGRPRLLNQRATNGFQLPKGALGGPQQHYGHPSSQKKSLGLAYVLVYMRRPKGN